MKLSQAMFILTQVQSSTLSVSTNTYTDEQKQFLQQDSQQCPNGYEKVSKLNLNNLTGFGHHIYYCFKEKGNCAAFDKISGNCEKCKSSWIYGLTRNEEGIEDCQLRLIWIIFAIIFTFLVGTAVCYVFVYQTQYRIAHNKNLKEYQQKLKEAHDRSIRQSETAEKPEEQPLLPTALVDTENLIMEETKTKTVNQDAQP